MAVWLVRFELAQMIRWAQNTWEGRTLWAIWGYIWRKKKKKKQGAGENVRSCLEEAVVISFIFPAKLLQYMLRSRLPWLLLQQGMLGPSSESDGSVHVFRDNDRLNSISTIFCFQVGLLLDWVAIFFFYLRIASKSNIPKYWLGHVFHTYFVDWP